VSDRHVLVVSPDERWLRVLEVMLRLGGFVPMARRSVIDALRVRSDDDPPHAIVLDLGPDSTTNEVQAVRDVLGSSDLRAVVILPERLSAQKTAFSATGAVVLVRPYAPSALYAALGGARGPAASGATHVEGSAVDGSAIEGSTPPTNG
jgi:ActR/RegA family two-component response regulator